MLKRRQKNLQDVEYILDNLRYEDFEELKALWGDEWREQTINSIMKTDFSVLIGVSDDKPVVMGGIWKVGGENSNVACVWMLSTKDVKRHIIFLMKEISKEIEDAQKKYSVLYNFIYKKNFQAKKWLKILGFRFDNPFPKGLSVPEGFEFFYKYKESEE